MSATEVDAILAHTVRPYLGRARAYPFVKWAGGKRALIPAIAAVLPKAFGTYWEPFVGGGAMFFALDSIVRQAQLSDVNDELMLAYAVIKNNPQALIDALQEHKERHSAEHYRTVRAVHGGLDAVAVAARFIYLNKTCYNGLYRVNRQGRFNVPMGRYKNPMICDAANMLAASEVLQKATVRKRSFEKCAPAPGDLVYCDPPYDETFAGYDARGFGPEQQRALRAQADAWRAKGVHVVLSNSDTPLIRGLYREYDVRTVDAPRNINCKADGRARVAELLITSF